MEKRLKHSEVAEIILGQAEAKVLNLDASIKSLIQPAAAIIKHTGDEVALHIVCCNEYGLVTGATAGLDIADVRKDLQSLRVALEQGKQTEG
jgi:hypothetical protein